MNVFKLIEDNGLTLHGDIEHFAELVRADEREACAKWLRDNYQDYKNIADICEAIRARGET